MLTAFVSLVMYSEMSLTAPSEEGPKMSVSIFSKTPRNDGLHDPMKESLQKRPKKKPSFKAIEEAS